MMIPLWKKLRKPALTLRLLVHVPTDVWRIYAITAEILKGRKVAKDVVLKIVPSTDDIWKQALEEGLISIFKEAGALVSNAGCAGCAAGQVGQNGPDEVTISTGNRNFAGKTRKRRSYIWLHQQPWPFRLLPDTLPDEMMENDVPPEFESKGMKLQVGKQEKETAKKPMQAEGRAWLVMKDDIDTDMIFHNRYLTITDINEMGQYALDNLEGYEDFAQKVQPNDIVITGKNFGAGSSRQQAVDCFKALGVSVILAQSYGAIYERNAINAAMPIMTYENQMLDALELENGDHIRVDFESGDVKNLTKNKDFNINPFYPVQKEIYLNDGLL